MTSLRDDIHPKIIPVLGMTPARRRIVEAGNAWVASQMPVQSLPRVRAPKCSPYWADDARKLRADGLTFKEIAAIVGRSIPRVHEVLTPHRRRHWVPPTAPIVVRTSEKNKRGRLRREARAESAATGEPVEAIYARWGIADVDRSLNCGGWRKARLDAEAAAQGEGA